MSFCSHLRSWAAAVAFVAVWTSAGAAESGGYMLGGGAEGDSDGGIWASALGGIGIGDSTWLSAGLASSSVDLPRGGSLDTRQANIEVDHSFDPIGVRLGASYWGDSDVLDSNDWHTALYWRGSAALLAVEYQFRDFDFIIPRTEFFAGRTIRFDADGIGATAQFDINDEFGFRISGMQYDYSVAFRPTQDRDIIDLFSVTRLSIINSLIDHRASLELGLDHGLKRWELEVATRESAVDQSRTRSATIRYLTPLTTKTDVEFGIGIDDSDVYGNVTYFSVFVYFYGD